MPNNNYNRNILAGCAVLFFMLVIGLTGILALFVGQDRQAGHYPGAMLIASHSNYNVWPLEYRWDDTYRTTDNFTTVYRWYSLKFDLGAEARAVEKCILLEGEHGVLVSKRQISVSLCNTPDGQMIFISRSTAFK